MERIVNLDPFKESMLEGQSATDAMLFEERYTHAFGMTMGEEIVRCRDCKWFHRSRVHCDDCWCSRFFDAESQSSVIPLETYEFGFCAWGDRK